MREEDKETIVLGQTFLKLECDSKNVWCHRRIYQGGES